VDDPDEMEKLFVKFSEGIFNNSNNCICCEFDEKITPITTWCVEQGIINQPKSKCMEQL